MSYAYRTYMDETLALARSLVIKFDDQNVLMNKRLAERGYAVSDNPTEWKYNLNLAGEYHPVDDTIYVISSDTQERIPFTQEMLLSHPRTRVDYTRGGRYYDGLIARHPNLKILINGITDPLPIATIVDAPNFSIMNWDSTLVAGNETRLISDLQIWVDQFMHRWYNNDFNSSDSYYSATIIVNLAAEIVNAIRNVRLKYAKTEHAAEFHIWSYLSDHYDLGDYRANLNQSQALWLYRNIKNIRNKVGRKDKLGELIENIMAPRGLAAEEMRKFQTAEQLLDQGVRTPVFSFMEQDEKPSAFTADKKLTSDEVIYETRDKGILNDLESSEDAVILEEGVSTDADTTAPTGLIRAYEDESIRTRSIELSLFKLTYWPYLADLGLYNPEALIEIPNNGDLNMTSMNWFILLIYASQKCMGLTPDVIPEVGCWEVAPVVPFVKSDITHLIDESYWSNHDWIDRLFINQVDVTTITDAVSFDAFVEEVYETKFQQENIWESQDSPVLSGMIQNIAAATWCNHKVTFQNQAGMAYNDWLNANSINLLGLTERDWFDLCKNILEGILGIETGVAKLTPDQTAMVAVMEKLTSYNLILTSKGTSRNSKRIDIPNIQMYDWTWLTRSRFEVRTGELPLYRRWDVDIETTRRWLDGLYAFVPDGKRKTIDIDSGNNVIIRNKVGLKRWVNIPANFITLDRD